VLDKTLCDKVVMSLTYNWLVDGQGTSVSSTNKSECHDNILNIVENGL
jgi:hypothetical protein